MCQKYQRIHLRRTFEAARCCCLLAPAICSVSLSRKSICGQKKNFKIALAVEATQCVVRPPELSIIARKGISNLWTNSACRARPNAKRHKC